MNANAERSMRFESIFLGSFYLIALIPATPLAYAGALWLDASQRGWRTQVAAGALVVGWLALAAGVFFLWRAAKLKQRSNLFLGAALGLAAIAAYTVVYEWGGRMLI